MPHMSKKFGLLVPQFPEAHALPSIPSSQPKLHNDLSSAVNSTQLMLLHLHHCKTAMSRVATMTDSAATGRLVEAVLSVVAQNPRIQVQYLSVESLLHLRATCRHLRDLITGHLPTEGNYELRAKLETCPVSDYGCGRAENRDATAAIP